MSFPGKAFIDEDALVILPYREIVVVNATIASGVSQTIDAAALPGHCIFARGQLDIGVAFTVGGGTTTGLSCEFGTDGNPDGLRATANLVGQAAGMNALGGLGALNGSAIDVAAPIPRLTLTATGGATELDDVDAGELIARMYFACVPADLTAQFA